MQFAANREGVIRPTALVGRPGPDWLKGGGPAVPHFPDFSDFGRGGFFCVQRPFGMDGHA